MTPDAKTVELLRSRYNSQTLAMSVDGILHGANAGPWDIVKSWEMDERAMPHRERAHDLDLRMKSAEEEIRQLAGDIERAIDVLARGKCSCTDCIVCLATSALKNEDHD